MWSPAGLNAAEITPSATSTVAFPAAAVTDSSTPLPPMKKTVEESGDHAMSVMPGPAASWRGLVMFPFGDGGATGLGDGMGGEGGCVTNVMVFGAVSTWPAAVLAVGPMVTWYWVFGARFPLVGRTSSVFAFHENATVVAGAI